MKLDNTENLSMTSKPLPNRRTDKTEKRVFAPNSDWLRDVIYFIPAILGILIWVLFLCAFAVGGAIKWGHCYSDGRRARLAYPSKWQKIRDLRAAKREWKRDWRKLRKGWKNKK